MLTGKRRLSSAAALVLLHAGYTMVAGIIDANFAIPRIDSQALLVAEECIARFVPPTGTTR